MSLRDVELRSQNYAISGSQVPVARLAEQEHHEVVRLLNAIKVVESISIGIGVIPIVEVTK